MRKKNCLLGILSFLFQSIYGQIKFTSVKTGLGTVTGITHANDGSHRIFVVSKSGTIAILDSNYNTLGSLLNISSLINTNSEMGLLGLAFHPNFANNGYFFVNYNPSGTRTSRISRFTLSPPSSNLQVNVSTEKQIINITDAANNNHKAGDLAFGFDGYLYITTGDGGSGNDPQGSGQNGNTLLGKILRLNIDTTIAYAAPPTNPFVSNVNIRDEIWDLGLRNPWRISFDRANGDLWIADVGQNAREEINYETAGNGGKNYGWVCREGFLPNSSSCSGLPGFTDPLFDYSHCSDPCPNPGFGRSITGGYVYRGTKSSNSALIGYYIFADFISKHAWILKQTPSGFRSVLDVRLISNLTTTGITSFGETERGEILAGLANGTLGTIDATRSLPIQLTRFDAFKENNRVNINWHTSSEQNILEYKIQRSKDGKVYENMGTVLPQNTSTNYVFYDHNPLPGTNYYRLAWTEYNHAYNFSDAVKLNWSSYTTTIYNKNKQELSWQGISSDNEVKVVRIFAMDGRLVASYNHPGTSVRLSNAIPGVYLSQLQTNDGFINQKVFIY